ncbi:flavin reductase family protein [Blastococcus brunescens]|uniref:Flavin reductase family protein n=1 Tax=Blastococcus brunescens TaxID=1564165 RepID=A0ABZ1B3Q3_9ACTN|nr:flavin reductase family protein [Blastococcus sp. BMG 8361]WRL65435.1 flavin reductase family protein [Blastococcus sp. BMG 8361]
MTETVATPGLDPQDPATFRRVLGHYPSGIAAVTSIGGNGEPVGMVVSSFTSVSLDPPLVSFSPAKTSTTWTAIRQRAAFCVNVLGADQEDTCRKLAAKGGDKFRGIEWAPDSRDLPALEGSVAWISCSLEAVHDAGDHEIAIGRVQRLTLNDGRPPLLFFRVVTGGWHPHRFSP